MVMEHAGKINVLKKTHTHTQTHTHSDHTLCHSSTDLCINCVRSAVKQSGYLLREKYSMCHVPM